jgi:hypothetical protein
MKFYLHRNYEIVDGKRIDGLEAATLIVFGWILDVRWYSANDGRTPHWSVAVHRNFKTYAAWTLYSKEN